MDAITTIPDQIFYLIILVIVAIVLIIIVFQWRKVAQSKNSILMLERLARLEAETELRKLEKMLKEIEAKEKKLKKMDK